MNTEPKVIPKAFTDYVAEVKKTVNNNELDDINKTAMLAILELIYRSELSAAIKNMKGRTSDNEPLKVSNQTS